MSGGRIVAIAIGVMLAILFAALAFRSEHFVILPDKVALYQGSSFPLDPEKVVGYKPEGGESKFVFAYNECRADCCKSSPFGCHGSGCVCVDAEQADMISGRGGNRRSQQGCPFRHRAGQLVGKSGFEFSSLVPEDGSNIWDK
jgi:hypothetical protein